MHIIFQTEVLAKACGVKNVGMLFTAKSPITGWRFNTLLATTHISLSEVPKKLTTELIHSKLDLFKDFCNTYTYKPTLKVAGLNPHAGEEGLLGHEEKDWLNDALITWNEKNKDIRLFGPFSKAKEVRKTLSVINSLFPYRSCTKKITGNDSSPCLDYHLKRCIAPCISACTKEEYEEVIKDVIKFLDGDHKFVIKKLNQDMLNASENKMYERAARIRDQIQSINEFHNL